MAIAEVLVGAAAAVVGSGLTIAGQWIIRRDQHRDTVTDSLREARAAAHSELIRESHLAAHQMLRTTQGHPAQLPHSSEVEVRIDAEVMHRTFQVELVAGDEATQAALALRQQLQDLRKVVKVVQWHDADYWAALTAYQQARSEYIRAARAEILLAAP